MGARPRRRRRAASKLRLRRWLRRKAIPGRGLAVALVALVALAVLAGALLVPRPKQAPPERRVARSASSAGGVSTAAGRREQAARSPVPRPHLQVSAPRRPPTPTRAPRAAPRVSAGSSGPRAAIVIDDLGQSLAHFEQLAGLNIPLSIAVIPGLPAAARTVSEAARRGIELLLHQPMEPHEEGGKDPGAGVLMTSMTPEALRAQVRASLAAVPGAVGVNNHMGSRFTEDTAGLGVLMAEIKAQGLFWLDSRTTPGTRGVEVARAAGVPALERDVFLDAEVNPDFIRRQLRKLLEGARRRGAAVGIGHPHPETIAVLRELRDELLASDVTLVPVSRLVRSQPESGPGTALAAAVADKGQAGSPTANQKTATP